MPHRQRISAIESHLGYWLRFVSNHVSHAFSRKLAARNITVAEWVFMRELFAGGDIAPNQLATRMGMTRGAISKLADRLVAKSFVTRTASKDDGRYQHLALTKSGQALVPALAALADQNDEEFFGHLDAAERARLAEAMKEIVRRRGLRSVPVD